MVHILISRFSQLRRTEACENYVEANDFLNGYLRLYEQEGYNIMYLHKTSKIVVSDIIAFDDKESDEQHPELHIKIVEK